MHQRRPLRHNTTPHRPPQPRRSNPNPLPRQSRQHRTRLRNLLPRRPVSHLPAAHPQRSPRPPLHYTHINTHIYSQKPPHPLPHNPHHHLQHWRPRLRRRHLPPQNPLRIPFFPRRLPARPHLHAARHALAQQIALRARAARRREAVRVGVCGVCERERGGVGGAEGA